uniref:Uncharacterized protein n=1 Tax=Panagrolaimus sp. ES5 TaxID=591445 RepID=A0AC34FQQ4_9BILA
MDSANNSRSPSPLRAGVSSSSSSTGSSSSDDSSRTRRRTKSKVEAQRSRSSSNSPLRSPSPSHPSSSKSAPPPAPAVRDDVRNPQDLLPTGLPGDDDSSKKIMLSEEELVKFELWAKGTSPCNRSEYFDKIAKVNSVAHRAPYLQRKIRPSSVENLNLQYLSDSPGVLNEQKVPTLARNNKFAKIDAPDGAGRLENFTNNWHKLTTDPFVLRAIKGYRIPFIVSPPRRFHDVAGITDFFKFTTKTKINSFQFEDIYM